MRFEKGEHVRLTIPVGEHAIGARAQVMRVDTAFFSADRYTILITGTDDVISDLSEEDLFNPDREVE